LLWVSRGNKNLAYKILLCKFWGEELQQMTSMRLWRTKLSFGFLGGINIWRTKFCFGFLGGIKIGVQNFALRILGRRAAANHEYAPLAYKTFLWISRGNKHLAYKILLWVSRGYKNRRTKFCFANFGAKSSEQNMPIFRDLFGTISTFLLAPKIPKLIFTRRLFYFFIIFEFTKSIYYIYSVFPEIATHANDGLDAVEQ